jgi:squalene cyclase
MNVMTGLTSTAMRIILAYTVLMLYAIPYSYAREDAPELTSEASKAITKGLAFIAENQNEDGSWGDVETGREKGTSSLCLMAFMSIGEFPGSGQYGETLDRGMKWLLAKAEEKPDGYIGSTMYEHGLATLALSEMWGMTRDLKDDEQIEKALKKAVDVILRSQNPGGGWRYQPQADGGEDTSCSQTVFHSLASARQAGITVPDETITRFVKYLEFARNLETGGFTYAPHGRARTSFACSAGGAYCAQLAGQRDSEMVNTALTYVKNQAPGIFEKSGGHYYYAHYYAIQAMVQAGDKHYIDWYPQIRDALVRQQQETGSWSRGKGKNTKDPVTHETPMAVIILATPHRYIPIYQR